ncbi:hypothetical protein FOL47_007702, partial [Perkinsus chesapeaki]
DYAMVTAVSSIRLSPDEFKLLVSGLYDISDLADSGWGDSPHENQATGLGGPDDDKRSETSAHYERPEENLTGAAINSGSGTESVSNSHETTSEEEEPEKKQYRNARAASMLSSEQCMTMVKEEETAKQTTRREAQDALKSFYATRQSRIDENKKANLNEQDKLLKSKESTWAKATANETKKGGRLEAHCDRISGNFALVTIARGSSIESLGSGEGGQQQQQQSRRGKDMDGGNTKQRMKLLMQELRNEELKVASSRRSNASQEEDNIQDATAVN